MKPRRGPLLPAASQSAAAPCAQSATRPACSPPRHAVRRTIVQIVQHVALQRRAELAARVAHDGVGVAAARVHAAGACGLGGPGALLTPPARRWGRRLAQARRGAGVGAAVWHAWRARRAAARACGGRGRPACERGGVGGRDGSGSGRPAWAGGRPAGARHSGGARSMAGEGIRRWSCSRDCCECAQPRHAPP
jgi:hypothetical protein